MVSTYLAKSTLQSSLNTYTIHSSLVRKNIQTLREKSSHSRLMVMLKANAYGSDCLQMSELLASCGIDIFGLAFVDEALYLREKGYEGSLFVLNSTPFETDKAVKYDLEIAVSDLNLIKQIELEANLQKKITKVHLHIDTGMKRFGTLPEKALELALYIDSSPFLQLEGVMTHFAVADDPAQDAYTLCQAYIFQTCLDQIENSGIFIPWKHASNSSALARFNFTQFNMARVGIAVYGLYSSEATKKALPLELALSLTSTLVGINTCKKGETISYGRRYTATREEEKIGILPLGYYDGLHRCFSPHAYVMIKGIRASIVGTICMDYLLIDLTDLSEIDIGEKVIIFGKTDDGFELHPEVFAEYGSTIVYELITCLGPRIQRLFKEDL